MRWAMRSEVGHSAALPEISKVLILIWRGSDVRSGDEIRGMGDEGRISGARG